MGSGHRGTGDGVGGSVSADPRTENVSARCENVNHGTVVGVSGNAPGRVDGTNGKGIGSGGGRGAASVGGAVTSSNDGQNAGGVGRVDGVVECGREATT